MFLFFPFDLVVAGYGSRTNSVLSAVCDRDVLC